MNLSSRSRSSSIAVVGATGHTGAFVVTELVARGFALVAIGRDPERLAAAGFDRRGIPTRIADVADPAALDRALEGVSAVINCAGPFLDTAAPVAAAALRAGAHYLDVTAEQASARATLTDLDHPARQAGVSVVPAVGFFGGLADLLATAATSGWDRVEDVRVGIALDRWHPTHGTRVTGKRNTVPRVVIDGGTLVPAEDPAARTTLAFAPPFGPQAVTAVPFTEVPLIAGHLRVDRLRTWLTDTALRDLRDPSTPPPVPADRSGRSDQRFLLEVVATGPGGTRRAAAWGRDIYATTAPIVVEAARRLCGDDPAPGAFAPGAIFDATDLLASLPASAELTVEVDDHTPAQAGRAG